MLLHPPLPADRHAAVFRRTRQVARVLLSNGLETLMERSGLKRHLPWWRRARTPEPAVSEARRLRLALGELGVTFIKLGQLLSTRADLLPEEHVRELALLQDAAPLVPRSELEPVLHAEWGPPEAWPFRSFDWQPLASASVGQVHAAELRNGSPVVVKLRRPGVVEQVELDLGIVRGLAEWAQQHTPLGHDVDLVAVTESLSNTLRNELDYVLEARHMQRMRRALAGDPGVSIPRAYPEFSSERVLVMERMGGVGIGDLAALDRLGLSRRALAENGVRLFLRQMLEVGFFHADPHPGNFFVQPDGSVALIDWGMVGHVSPRLRHGLLRAGLAAVHQDPESLADELFALGVAGERVDRVAFERDLDLLLTRYGDQTLQQLSAAVMVEEFMRIVFRHHLILPGELALLLRVAAISEGIGLKLDPGFRYLEHAAGLFRQRWRSGHSLRATAGRARRALAEGFELGLELPRRSARLLARLEHGDLQMTVNHRGLRSTTTQFQHMTNRLSLAIVLGASIVALALATGVRPIPALEPVLPWLFWIALVFSLLFGASLVWTMWRAGRSH